MISSKNVNLNVAFISMLNMTILFIVHIKISRSRSRVSLLRHERLLEGQIRSAALQQISILGRMTRQKQ